MLSAGAKRNPEPPSIIIYILGDKVAVPAESNPDNLQAETGVLTLC